VLTRNALPISDTGERVTDTVGKVAEFALHGSGKRLAGYVVRQD
jgi:hypothetical protein